MISNIPLSFKIGYYGFEEYLKYIIINDNLIQFIKICEIYEINPQMIELFLDIAVDYKSHSIVGYIIKKYFYILNNEIIKILINTAIYNNDVQMVFMFITEFYENANHEEIKEFINTCLIVDSLVILVLLRQYYDKNLTNNEKDLIDRRIITLNIFKRNNDISEWIVINNPNMKKIYDLFKNANTFDSYI